MGGRIEVESTLRLGTTFAIMFPVAPERNHVDCDPEAEGGQIVSGSDNIHGGHHG